MSFVMKVFAFIIAFAASCVGVCSLLFAAAGVYMMFAIPDFLVGFTMIVSGTTFVICSGMVLQWAFSHLCPGRDCRDH